MQSRIDELTVRLIRNTIKRNSSRADNILIIAKDIQELIELTGSIKKAANILNISQVMLQKFLSVNKLSDPVKKLVEERKFDNVQAIYDIKSLSASEQLIIAKLVIDKKITGTDVKAIIPQKNASKNLPIEKIVAQLIASKDIKIYSAFIALSKKLSSTELEKILFSTIDKRLIYSVSIKNNAAKISFTKEGYAFIKKEVKTKKQTIKQYLNFIINGK